MKELPLPTKLYVGAVIAVGACLLIVFLPQATFADPLLFVILLLLSSISSIF